MPQFQTFTKSLIALKQEPSITVQMRGTISINTAAYVALDSPAAVELLYDPDAGILGLRAVATSVGHAAFVRPATKSGRGPFIVSAMAFIKYYDIDTSEARRYSAHVDGDALCVDLRGPFTPVSKKRAASDKNPEAQASRPRSHELRSGT